MAIPTSYTYNTFADYLKNEVLQQAADSLGWGDTVEETPAVTQQLVVLDIYGNGKYAIAPSEMKFNQYQTITFDNGKQRTLDQALNLNDIILYANPSYSGTELTVGDAYTRTIQPAMTRVRNPIYNLVTDEVLNKMGLTNINQIDATNIKMFRLIGRVELLRRAMQNTAADFSYLSEGQGVARNQVYQHLIALFTREENRLNRVMFEAGADFPDAIIPVESESASVPTTLVW